MSAAITSDPCIKRQIEMGNLKRQILSQRGAKMPRMVTPLDDRCIDYKGSDSVNSRLRRILAMSA